MSLLPLLILVGWLGMDVTPAAPGESLLMQL